MKRNNALVGIGLIIILVGVVGGIEVGLASSLARPLLQAGAPTIVSYQGLVKVGGNPYNGTGYFKFAIIDEKENTFWTNDHSAEPSGEPVEPVELVVSNGLFNVLLGDTDLKNMFDLPASVFDERDRYLRVWFSSDNSTFTLLLPDQHLAAVPYALQAEIARQAGDADTLDSYHAGHSNGYVPVSDGALNNNLNADLLDGYSTGNASGNVPLNNGTLNTNLNADLLDSLHASDIRPHYQGYVVVAKSGGDYTTISAALAAITGTTTNRYLVKVMPGVYNEQVTMKPYIDIEGSGELTTKVTSTGSSANCTPTILGASNAELRFLTVENTGGYLWAVAICNTTASPYLTHITTIATGSYNNVGIHNVDFSAPIITNVVVTTTTNITSVASNTYGIYNTSSYPVLRDVSIYAVGKTNSTNYAFYNSYSNIMMTNVNANATGGTNTYAMNNSHSSATIQFSILNASGATNNRGINNYSSGGGSYTVIVNSSQIIASNNTILSNHNDFTTRVGASLLSGGPINVTGGTVTCYACYDESYTNTAVNVCP